MRITAANLGDSGFAIIRKGDIIYKSRDLQHTFNTPFQLSIVPKPLSANIGDHPSAARLSWHQCEPEDTIILATDGLWDNMSLESIVDVIETSLSIEDAGRSLVDMAKQISLDNMKVTPFGLAARAVGRLHYGG